MANEEVHPTAVDSTQPYTYDRTNSSTTSSSQSNEPVIHTPLPTRPQLPSRKSSGPLVVPRDSDDARPAETWFSPDDARAMSPRRTTKEVEVMNQKAREELERHTCELRQRLLMIVNRVEMVRVELDKLDKDNKLLQEYIDTLEHNQDHCDG